jgi:hypothetical protein
MDINFYYLNETGEKDDTHIPIFELSISQKEGEVALAKLLVPTTHAFAGICKKALIVQSQDGVDKPLFIGRQVSFPRRVQVDVSEIELCAAPDDAHAKLHSLTEQLKLYEPYNPLFFNEEDTSPSNYLEATPKLFHWNRVTGNVTVSSIFEGSK